MDELTTSLFAEANKYNIETHRMSKHDFQIKTEYSYYGMPYSELKEQIEKAAPNIDPSQIFITIEYNTAKLFISKPKSIKEIQDELNKAKDRLKEYENRKAVAKKKRMATIEAKKKIMAKLSAEEIAILKVRL